MDAIKNSIFVRVISFILITTFLTLDISWAYPPDSSPRQTPVANATLATPLLTLRIAEQAAKFEGSEFKNYTLLTALSAIGKNLLVGSADKAIEPLKPRRLAAVIRDELERAGLVDILGPERLDVENFKTVVWEGNTLQVLGDDDRIDPYKAIILIPYKSPKNGQDIVIQIALSNTGAASELIGYDYLLSDTFTIKYVTRNFGEGVEAAVERSTAETKPVTAAREPAVVLSEPLPVETPAVVESVASPVQPAATISIRAIVRTAMVALVSLFATGAWADGVVSNEPSPMFYMALAFCGVLAGVIGIRVGLRKFSLLLQTRSLYKDISKTILRQDDYDVNEDTVFASLYKAARMAILRSSIVLAEPLIVGIDHAKNNYNLTAEIDVLSKIAARHPKKVAKLISAHLYNLPTSTSSEILNNRALCYLSVLNGMDLSALPTSTREDLIKSLVYYLARTSKDLCWMAKNKPTKSVDDALKILFKLYTLDTAAYIAMVIEEAKASIPVAEMSVAGNDHMNSIRTYLERQKPSIANLEKAAKDGFLSRHASRLFKSIAIVGGLATLLASSGAWADAQNAISPSADTVIVTIAEIFLVLWSTIAPVSIIYGFKTKNERCNKYLDSIGTATLTTCAFIAYVALPVLLVKALFRGAWRGRLRWRCF